LARHRGHHRLRDRERAAQIGAVERVEPRERQLGEWPEQTLARVVHEQVDPPRALEHGADRAPDRIGIVDVEAHRVEALRLELADRLRAARRGEAALAAPRELARERARTSTRSPG
jgi:hypothetical protein